MKDELKAIKKKYPSPRLTTILDKPEEAKTISQGVRDWEVCITAAKTLKFLDRDDYVAFLKKKTASSSLPSMLLTDTLELKAEQDVFVFTNRGNCARMNLKNSDAHPLRSSGAKIDELVEGLEKGEYPVGVLKMEDAPGDKKEILFFTKQGAVKRSDWSEYDVKKSVFPAMKLAAGDEVLRVEHFDPDVFSTALFVTKKGLALNANKDTIPCQGRVSGGVKGIALNAGDEVVFATQQTGEGEIIVATSFGTFKRVVASQFDPQNRATKGMMVSDVKTRDGKGDIIFAGYVTDPYYLGVSCESGVQELYTEDISIENRVSKGKSLSGIKNVASVCSLKFRTESVEKKMRW